MGKITALVHPVTGDTAYPTTSHELVLDNNGSNLLGYTEKEFNEIQKNIINSTNKISKSNNSIKSLKGRNSTLTELEIAKGITLLEINNSRLINIVSMFDLATNKASNISSDLTEKDFYLVTEIKDLVNNIPAFCEFIEYGTPKKAPIRNRIMVDKKNVYFGIGYSRTWYVVNIDDSYFPEEN